MRMVVAMTLVGVGLARADHTAADARATTAKLEAIRRAAYAPPAAATKKKATPAPAPAPRPEAKVDAKVEARVDAEPKPEAPKRKESDGNPLWSLMVHAWSIPFDAKEREAHLRDIPKTPAEVDAHLRRLDAALSAKHRSR